MRGHHIKFGLLADFDITAKENVRMWMNSSWLKKVSCEHSNKPSGATEGSKFLN
jgi:hypothetical protein